LTPASDVFSLGCVLAWANTGASPFAGSSTLQVLNNVVAAAPDLAGVPGRLREVVEPCLAKDPAARPAPAQLLDAQHRAPVMMSRRYEARDEIRELTLRLDALAAEHAATDHLGDPGRRALFDELAGLVECCLALEREAVQVLT
jgi:serine/threonine protein kinase